MERDCDRPEESLRSDRNERFAERYEDKPTMNKTISREQVSPMSSRMDGVLLLSVGPHFIDVNAGITAVVSSF